MEEAEVSVVEVGKFLKTGSVELIIIEEKKDLKKFIGVKNGFALQEKHAESI